MKLYGLKAILFITIGLFLFALLFYFAEHQKESLLSRILFFKYIYLFMVITCFQVITIRGNIFRIYKFSMLFSRNRRIDLDKINEVVIRIQGFQIRVFQLNFIGDNFNENIHGCLTNIEDKSLGNYLSIIDKKVTIELD